MNKNNLKYVNLKKQEKQPSKSKKFDVRKNVPKNKKVKILKSLEHLPLIKPKSVPKNSNTFVDINVNKTKEILKHVEKAILKIKPSEHQKVLVVKKKLKNYKELLETQLKVKEDVEKVIEKQEEKKMKKMEDEVKNKRLVWLESRNKSYAEAIRKEVLEIKLKTMLDNDLQKQWEKDKK